MGFIVKCVCICIYVYIYGAPEERGRIVKSKIKYSFVCLCFLGVCGGLWLSWWVVLVGWLEQIRETGRGGVLFIIYY